jgi:hypothetical protein
MKFALAIALLLTIWTRPVAAQLCPGDGNQDLMTTVDEIVSAVDSALNGCGGGCPLHFDEITPEGENCFYLGRWNPLCGPGDLEAFFINDGKGLIVSFFDPDVDFFADVVDEGIANLFAWELVDSGEGLEEIEGEVLLSDPPSEALTVYPDTIPFDIGECAFERYEGRFFQYEVSSAARSSKIAARAARSRARLKALHDDPKFVQWKSKASGRKARSR